MNILKLLEKLDDISSACGVIFFIILTLVAFTQVVARYCFGSTLMWPEEACRFAFIWMAYLGMSSCMRHDSHLKVDAITSILRGKTKKTMYFIDMLITSAFCLFVTYCGYDMLTMVVESEQVALTLPIPLVYVWVAIPLTFFMAALHALANIAKMFSEDKD